MTHYHKSRARTKKLITALTIDEPKHPPFISITDTGDGNVVVSMRGNPVKSFGDEYTPGGVARLTMTRAHYEFILKEMIEHQEFCEALDVADE